MPLTQLTQLLHVKPLASLCALSLLSSFASSGPALGADGIRELDQTCALQTGCLANDTPGFPITIDETGSYVVTSNQVLPSPNVFGLQVEASDLSSDLNGFSIVPFGGEGSTTDCTPSPDSGGGIKAGRDVRRSQ